MAITKEQIFAAADKLDAVDQAPTLAAVRRVIGGGSFTTISEAMNEWRASKIAQAIPAHEPLPQAVTDKLTELGASLWNIALDMANNRLAAEREALKTIRIEMEAARQEATELADQLTAELDETKSRLASIEAAEVAARNEADAMRERVTTSEARAAELRTELDHAHQEVRQLRAERDQAEAKFGERASQVDQLRAELATVKAKAEAADQVHQEQRRATAQEAHRQAERLTAVQAERDKAWLEVATAKEEAATLRGRVQTLENMLPASRKTVKNS